MKQEKRLHTIDGAKLMSQPLRPPNFIADSLLSQGLHILAGSPKVGNTNQIKINVEAAITVQIIYSVARRKSRAGSMPWDGRAIVPPTASMKKRWIPW